MASKLASAQSSRTNGSAAGFGYLSGSISKGDTRSTSEINNTHNLIKRQQLAASRGDWETYNSIANQLKFA